MFTALVLTALFGSAEAPKEKELSADAKKELKKLEGKWKLVKGAASQGEMEFKDGDETPQFEFKGTEIILSCRDKKETARVSAIDATTDPMCIDLVEKKGDGERTIEGVYKLDGDALLLALAQPKDGKIRPSGFEKPTDALIIVWTFKKVKE